MPGRESDALTPDDPLGDADLSFDEAEIPLEPAAPAKPAPNVSADELVTLDEDANVPLDVEPDPEVVSYDAEALDEPVNDAAPQQELELMRAELAATRAELQQARRRAESAEHHLAEQPDTEMVEKRELDAAEHRVGTLSTDNARLKSQLEQTRKRDAPAGDGDTRKIQQLARENEDLRSELETTHALVEAKLAEIEDANRQLAQALKEAGASKEAARAAKAELEAATNALAEAEEKLAAATDNGAEAQRVPKLEDRVAALQVQVTAKEKEVAEVQEKLDTEAARSYRLSQRRIPALNMEIEEAQEQARELERKAQKAELRAQTLEDTAAELRNRMADLERALAGAKARAQDTRVTTPADVDSGTVVADELHRAAARLREVEAERAQLAESLRRIGEAHGQELTRHQGRAEKLEKEGEQRLEDLLGQRTLLRVLRERVQNMLQVAEDLASARDGQRKVLLEALRKLAEVPAD